MPINLSNMSDVDKYISNVKDPVTPKLFNKDLTGNGRYHTGLLNVDTGHLSTMLNGQKQRSLIPFGSLSNEDQNEDRYLNKLINLNPSKLDYYNNKDVAKNHINLFNLPLPQIATQGSIYKFDLDQPLGMFGLDQLDKNFTQLPSIDYKLNYKQTHYRIYARTLVTSIHSYAHRVLDKNNKSTYTDLNVAYSLTPIIVITNDTATDLSHKACTVHDYQDSSVWVDIANHQDRTHIIYNSALEDVKYTVNDTYLINPQIYKALIHDWIEDLYEVSSATNINDVLTKLQQHNVNLDLNHSLQNITETLIPDTIKLIQVAVNDISQASSVKKSVETANYVVALITTFSQIADKLQNHLTSDDYQVLVDELMAHADYYDLNTILSLDLRLLLANKLTNIKKLVDQNLLYQFKPVKSNVDHALTQNPNYSNQQKAIIRTTEPLTVGTAGAGSGKSHTLVGRLQYLKDQGEDLSKVLVLSFTNTAADNIKQRYPHIQSETLAKMIDNIYRKNFPSQTLSNDNTLINVLNGFNLNNAYFSKYINANDPNRLAAARESLIDALREIEPKNPFTKVDPRHGTSVLLHTLACYLDEILVLLNAAKQTSLTLEPLIIYTMLFQNRTIQFPDEYQSLKYIITDESQDISTFEYILLLDLTVMYRSNLMIIGDGSQTLYEFRNANPQFMNTLETSDVFKTYHLTTNYRSNHEILTYANQFLSIIDANKNANIRLRPNSFDNVDLDSFHDKVRLDSFCVESYRQEAYRDDLESELMHNQAFRKWIVTCYQNHEQIALLTWKNRDLKSLSAIVTQIINEETGDVIEPLSLQPDRHYDDSNLSNAIYEIDREVKQIPMSKLFLYNYQAKIEEQVIKQMKAKHVKSTFIPKYIENAFDFLRRSTYLATLINKAVQSKSTKDRNAVLGFIKENLIQNEIKYNNVSLSKLNNKHRLEIQAKLPTAPVIISTIHSAKGLEFDHTVVLYNEPAGPCGAMTQEEARMYMVALTRAKKSEYIINTYIPSHESFHMTIDTSKLGLFHTPMETAYRRVESKY